VYRIGSMTKQLTAAAVLQLVERGRLSLGDTLGALLPGYRRWGGVTVRQLLAHTSGIPTFNLSRRWQARRAEDLPVDSVLALVADDSLRFAPGTRFEYSNTGYLLLGRIVERSSGMPLASYFHARFFEPLGMRTARVCPDTATMPAEAHGYEVGPDGLEPAEPIGVATFGGAGALCMSVPDFLHWDAALASGRVVSMASYRRMSASDTLASGRATQWGWGLRPVSMALLEGTTHGGDINGFAASNVWLPADSLRIVAFTNTFHADPERLVNAVARAVRGFAPLPPRPLVPPELRATIAGRWRLVAPTGDSTMLAIWTLGEQTMARLELAGGGTLTLAALPSGELAAVEVPRLRVRIERDEGRVVGLELRAGGLVWRGRRAPVTSEGTRPQ
jgi:CubicO group peptidase (beta-lactamase class C family)